MKKIYLFASFLSFNSMALNAQITLTDSYFPSGGDSLVTANANLQTTRVTRVTPASATSQTWDYSYLRATTAQARTIERFRVINPVTDTAILSTFPAADIVTSDTIGQISVYNKTSTRFELLGFHNATLGILRTSVRPVFTPPSLERRATLIYNSTNRNQTGFNLTASSDIVPDTILAGLPITPDSFRVRFQTNRTDKVDAWGTVRIPGSAPIPCLRERRYEITQTKIEAHIPRTTFWIDVTTFIFNGSRPPQDTTIEYLFWASAHKEPLVTIRTENDTVATSVSYKWLPINTNTEDLSANGHFKLIANLVQNNLNFDINYTASNNYTLSIFNLEGKSILTKNVSAGVQSLDISDLTSGTYIAHLSSTNAQKQAVILGKEKFVVIR